MKRIVVRGFLCASLLFPLYLHAAMIPFSVKDSIQMSRFNEQSLDGRSTPMVVNESPDKVYGLVLTSRGLLQSNQIQSTLWLIDYRKLRRTLDGARVPSSRPMSALATISAIPEIDARGAGVYSSVIFNVRWAPDSQNVYFLGENSQGNRQLYSVSVKSRVTKVLTPLNRDVESFDVAQHTILYRASTVPAGTANSAPGEIIAPGVSRVTGMSITDIVGNDRIQERKLVGLWCIRNGKPEYLGNLSRSPEVSSFLLAHPLALAPNARFGITLLRSATIPRSWERFETPEQFGTLRLDHRDARPTSPYNIVDPLREYSVVDLQHHNMWRLGAIDAHYFNFPGAASVRWSANGVQLLLTNVFLSPQETDNDQVKPIYPCAAAIFDLEEHTSHCLAFGGGASLAPVDTHLQSASLNQAGDEAILNYGGFDRIPSFKAVYHFFAGTWAMVNTSPKEMPGSASKPTPSLLLTVREGLNERPRLWAKDSVSGREMMVWDPNPNFDHLELGQASVFHWTDRHGRSWSGGLFLPVGYVKEHRYPLVIQTHGFTPTRFVVDGAYPTAMAARALASAGIMVLQVGQDGDPHDIGSREEASDNVQAYEAAIDALEAAGLIDSSKVGIVGFSRTCWYVENALIRSPHRFRAAIIADGVSYSYMQYHLFGPGDAYVQKDYEQMIGTVPVGKGFRKWLERAPDFHADQIVTPLRIEAIRPTSLLDEWELYSSLVMHNRPVDLIYYPDGQHILQKPQERITSEEGNVDWFRFWLQGYEDPNPIKQAQNGQWRLLNHAMEVGVEANR